MLQHEQFKNLWSYKESPGRMLLLLFSSTLILMSFWDPADATTLISTPNAYFPGPDKPPENELKNLLNTKALLLCNYFILLG